MGLVLETVRKFPDHLNLGYISFSDQDHFPLVFSVHFQIILSHFSMILFEKKILKLGKYLDRQDGTIG